MRFILGLFLFITTLLGDENMSIYDIEVKDIDGKVFTMKKYENRVMLIPDYAIGKFQSKQTYYKI